MIYRSVRGLVVVALQREHIRERGFFGVGEREARVGAADVADQQAVTIVFLAAPGSVHRMFLDPVMSATYYTDNRFTG
jgi:hypothetical protein